MGGSLPALACRVAGLSGHMGCPLAKEEILDSFRSFYFDTALSAHDTTLAALNSFTSPERLLFGTDIPAVSVSMAQWFSTNLKDAVRDTEQMDMIMGGNAQVLLNIA